MAYFGKFYLDKEKDIIISLYMISNRLTYILETPNHSTGNLITNLARLCELEISYNQEGLKTIEGIIPCYIDGENRKVYVLRLANTKIANIYEDGTIERKAYIPAIAKTLMSQTKDYNLDIKKTLVKTYILEELKFHSDLHTHRSANLSPDLLISLGIFHQLNYPYYYIKKLGLKLTERQKTSLEKQRAAVAQNYQNSELNGKHLDRKIDDHTFINFADLILNNLINSSYNISKIRNSLSVMKDGQAVFTNLEKVYLYRYVFTKGTPCQHSIELNNIEMIPDQDIVSALLQMEKDREHPVYKYNTLYQNKLLWIARSYQKVGITYAEISDTSLVKRSEAASTLQEIHRVMPTVTKETGVTLRFLAALRRTPLTIVKDSINRENYFAENLQVLKAVTNDPYLAGSDFVGEEINDIRDLKPVIQNILEIAAATPGYVLRVHAGENDSLPDNVYNSVKCVEESLKKNQQFPHMRIGHGLYTANLKSKKGLELLDLLKKREIILEFQITSNVRLNNLSDLKHHPLKQYIHEGIRCVQGTDGGALYGTDSIDEQLSLERMLELNYDEIMQMKKAEKQVIDESIKDFRNKDHALKKELKLSSIQEYYQQRIDNNKNEFLDLPSGERSLLSENALSHQVKSLPLDKIPIVIAGGSFNHIGRKTKMQKKVCKLLDDLLEKGDPEQVFFVIGPTLSGYEKYILDHAKDRFEVYCFIPHAITEIEYHRYTAIRIPVRISIESSILGTYKSIAYEIFKRRQSIILVLDGNSAASNLIQDAKNSKYKSRTFISDHCRTLHDKAESLQGYITILNEEDQADEILSYVNKYYRTLDDPVSMILKKKHTV